MICLKESATRGQRKDTQVPTRLSKHVMERWERWSLWWREGEKVKQRISHAVKKGGAGESLEVKSWWVWGAGTVSLGQPAGEGQGEPMALL